MMEDELVRPDPWYVNLAIANALEKLATEVRARGERRVRPDIRFAICEVADAIDEHVSKMRGQLGREADAQARAEEDRDRPHTQAYGWTP